VLTGKGLEYGGSLIRPEATGYGAVYLAAEMLATRGQEVRGKVAAVSASGNVAQYTVEKVNQLGGKVITLSDSDGTIVDEAGVDPQKLAFVLELKNIRRGRISEYAEKYKGVVYYRGRSVWDVIQGDGLRVDLAFPSARENEIDEEQASALVRSGCTCVSEGANMPCNLDAVRVLQENNVLFAPAKAANAGGVATSGLEMSQNHMRLSWTREEVDARLQGIMKSIHRACVDASAAYGRPGDYLVGANIAGFTKVANAMVAQGIV
jgi:glutamate dehydrogenase (NADP+)